MNEIDEDDSSFVAIDDEMMVCSRRNNHQPAGQLIRGKSLMGLGRSAF